MGLIKDNVNEQLDLIVKKLFEGNRVLDRIVNQLDLRFVMNKTSSILHPKLAHQYPLLADKISEYQGDRNNETIYGETFRDATVYGSPLRIFEKIVGYQMELEKVINDGIELSMDESDYFTLSFLQSFALDVIPYTKQSLLLLDKARLYDDDWMGFDRDIENFIIL